VGLRDTHEGEVLQLAETALPPTLQKQEMSPQHHWPTTGEGWWKGSVPGVALPNAKPLVVRAGHAGAPSGGGGETGKCSRKLQSEDRE
jgi:hypothetical protein